MSSSPLSPSTHWGPFSFSPNRDQLFRSINQDSPEKTLDQFRAYDDHLDPIDRTALLIAAIKQRSLPLVHDIVDHQKPINPNQVLQVIEFALNKKLENIAFSILKNYNEIIDSPTFGQLLTKAVEDKNSALIERILEQKPMIEVVDAKDLLRIIFKHGAPDIALKIVQAVNARWSPLQRGQMLHAAAEMDFAEVVQLLLEPPLLEIDPTWFAFTIQQAIHLQDERLVHQLLNDPRPADPQTLTSCLMNALISSKDSDLGLRITRILLENKERQLDAQTLKSVLLMCQRHQLHQAIDLITASGCL